MLIDSVDQQVLYREDKIQAAISETQHQHMNVIESRNQCKLYKE